MVRDLVAFLVRLVVAVGAVAKTGEALSALEFEPLHLEIGPLSEYAGVVGWILLAVNPFVSGVWMLEDFGGTIPELIERFRQRLVVPLGHALAHFLLELIGQVALAKVVRHIVTNEVTLVILSLYLVCIGSR